MSFPRDYLVKPEGWEGPPLPPEDRFSTMNLDQRRADSVKNLLFNTEGTLLDHFKFLKDESSRPVYLSVLLVLFRTGAELPFHSKWKVLAASFACKEFDLSNYLLYETNQFNLPEVVRAVKILDLPRKRDSILKKMARLRKSGARKKTIAKLRSRLPEIEKEMVPFEKVDLPVTSGEVTEEDEGEGETESTPPPVPVEVPDYAFRTSVSGCLSRRIRKWVGKFTPSELAFFSVQMPREPWLELSDIIHLSPSDFTLPHFLTIAFGAEAPVGGLIDICQKVTRANVVDLVESHEVPYSYLRKKIPNLPAEAKVRVAEYEKIDTLIWYYEEFTDAGAKDQIDVIMDRRISAGEIPSFNYGKLLERILYFKMHDSQFFEKLIPLAQAKLEELDLPLETPFKVIGDASPSMGVAIRSSTIIASFVACLTDAHLSFFASDVFLPKVQPRNIREVIETAINTETRGRTNPAASLWDAYQRKERVKIFLMATDEEENMKHEGYWFHQLFYKYCTEVYPAKLVLVSFLKNPSANVDGIMTKALKFLEMPPTVFVMHSGRPDLSKLDKLISLLSMETRAFLTAVDKLVGVVRKLGFKAGTQADVEVKAEEEEEGEMVVHPPEVVAAHEDGSIPEEFLCPITHDLMTDPAVACDGYVYERSAIVKWLKKKRVSPMTNEVMPTDNLFPNQQLKSRIIAYVEGLKRQQQEDGGGSDDTPA